MRHETYSIKYRFSNKGMNPFSIFLKRCLKYIFLKIFYSENVLTRDYVIKTYIIQTQKIVFHYIPLLNRKK